MTRNDEIRRLLDTLLATRTDAVSPYMRERARGDAAMRLAYECDALLGSIVPALLAENEEQARRIERLEDAHKAAVEEQGRYRDFYKAERLKAERLETVTHLGIGTGSLCNTAGEETDNPDLATCLDCLRVYADGQAVNVERLERALAAEQGREGLEGWERASRSGRRYTRDCAAVWAICMMPGAPVVWLWRVLDAKGKNVIRKGHHHTAIDAMEAAEAALRGDS